MKRIYPLLLICTALLLFTGCIKDNLSDCSPAGIKVYFTYPSTYAAEGIDPSDIEQIDLFVFNLETGLLVAMERDEHPRLSPDYYMTIQNLPEGTYRIAAWGGLKGAYATSPATCTMNQTYYNDMRVVFDHTTEVTDTIGHLFFAGKDRAEVSGLSGQSFSLPLVQNSNTIHLTTSGLVPCNDIYELRIADNNDTYQFDNSFAPEGSDFIYKSVCEKDAAAQPFTDLRVLKLASGRRVLLELYDTTTGVAIFRCNLVDLLEARGVDFDLRNEYDIHLEFKTDMSVSVSIDGWQMAEGGMIL